MTQKPLGRRLIRRACLLAAALVLVTVAAQWDRLVAFSEKVLIANGAFRVPVTGMRAGGGQKVQFAGHEVVMSFGGTAIALMEGGNFKIGTDIVGGIVAGADNLNNAHAFPVPFMPSRGHTVITFSNLSNSATIRIYTMAGELVKELVKNDPASDRMAWFPVQNQVGQDVASGVYVWVIESGDGQTKNGKLMVIK